MKIAVYDICSPNFVLSNYYISAKPACYMWGLRQMYKGSTTHHMSKDLQVIN